MKLPETYRKLVADAYSRDFRSVARIQEVPLEPPGPHDVVMRNRFAGVNASDVNISGGVYLTPGTFPFDLGVESVGEVVAVGEKVSHLTEGQAVLSLSPGGGYREYFKLPAAMAFPIPEASPEMLTIGLSGTTAAIGLFDVGELAKGEAVLITAAAGATGSYAVQLARRAGAHVIGTCSSEAKAALLRELGADRVVDYKRESLDEVLTREYPRGVNVVYESVGGELFDVALDHLAQRGRLLVVGYISEYDTGAKPVTQPRVYDKLLWKSAQIRAYIMGQYAERIGPRMAELFGAYARGEIRALVDETRYQGLDSVCDAVEALHAGKNSGKVVVRLAE